MGWSGSGAGFSAKADEELLCWLTDREIASAFDEANDFAEHAQAMAAMRAKAERRRRVGQAMCSELPFSLRFSDSTVLKRAAMDLYRRVYGSHPLGIVLQ